MEQRLEPEDYMTQYVETDYFESTLYKSQEVVNFLSAKELQAFDDAGNSEDAFVVTDTSMEPAMKQIYNEENTLTAKYKIFDSFYDNIKWRHLVDIIQPKLEREFGKGIRASHIHILESHVPYGLHSDSEQPNLKSAPAPAWTIIIPLDDYPSKTYQFNERSNLKDPMSWVRAHNIQKKPQPAVDMETFEKDFAPLTAYESLEYLSVESIFHWKKGNAFASDRFRFHCSDNYYNHGIKSKRALVLWTSLPTEDTHYV